MINVTPHVSARYGAQLGRKSDDNQTAHEVVKGELQLVRVNLDEDGYDDGCVYWGVGAPLFCAYGNEGDFVSFVRAADRDAAKAKFPKCSFADERG